jgi:hypothetical protein
MDQEITVHDVFFNEKDEKTNLHLMSLRPCEAFLLDCNRYTVNYKDPFGRTYLNVFYVFLVSTLRTL